MRIKLIQASSMAEAMRRIRAELGDEALILGNRRIAGGVEITAALEPPPDLPGATPEVFAPAHSEQGHSETSRPPDIIGRAEMLCYGTLDWSKPVMLVGTPGAGKTLTAAKLATQLRREGETPMIISADGERAAAAEQLAAFTRILELDLTIAENPLSLARALVGKPPGHKAIIDMAGYNPFDPEQKEALLTHALAADARLVWVHPAGLDAEDAAEMAEAFVELGVRYLIPTKLDMTRRLESVLRAAEVGNFILTYAGIGSGIADGIISLNPSVLTARINIPTAYFKTRQAA